MGFEDGMGSDPLDKIGSGDEDISVPDQIRALARELALGPEPDTVRALGDKAIDPETPQP